MYNNVVSMRYDGARVDVEVQSPAVLLDIVTAVLERCGTSVDVYILGNLPDGTGENLAFIHIDFLGCKQRQIVPHLSQCISHCCTRNCRELYMDMAWHVIMRCGKV